MFVIAAHITYYNALKYKLMVSVFTVCQTNLAYIYELVI